jgi:hypothetical protein
MLRLKMGTKEQEAKDSVSQELQTNHIWSNDHLQGNAKHHSTTPSNFSADNSYSSSNAMLRELFLARKWCTAWETKISSRWLLDLKNKMEISNGGVHDFLLS